MHVLAIGSACLVLPYLLLAAPAGYLADRFSKRSVIVGCKFAEIIMMAAAIVVIEYGHVNLMFVVVALIGIASGAVWPGETRQHSRDVAARKNLIGQRRAWPDDGRCGSGVGTAVGNWLARGNE